MICEANHGWFAEMQHNGIRIFSTANLGSEPSRGSQRNSTRQSACAVSFSFLMGLRRSCKLLRPKGGTGANFCVAKFAAEGACDRSLSLGSSPAGGAKQNPLSKEGRFLFVLFTFHYSSFIIHLSQADFE